jgi:hypothetical protein
LGRLEDTFDRGRRNEETERLTGEGGSQVLGFASVAAVRGEQAEQQPEAAC